MALEQGNSHLELFDTRQDMPHDLFDDETIVKLLDIGFSEPSAGFLKDVIHNPDLFKTKLQELRGRIEHDCGIIHLSPAYLAACFIKNHISQMYHEQALEAFHDDSAPLFVLMYDLSHGILQPISGIILGENQIHDRNDAFFDEQINTVFEFYADPDNPQTAIDYAENYAIVSQMALEAADMLRQDPTGFTYVDHILSALETGEENVFLRQLGQHVRPFIRAGATFSAEMYKTLYPLAVQALY